MRDQEKRGARVGRRGLLGSAAALAATGLLSPSRAEAATAARPRALRGLPARGDYVIRDAFILTMDASLGDIPQGDIHVRNGAIRAVGPRLDAGKAETIDGLGMIALPGLIDTHWHMWEALARNMAGEEAKTGYFPHSRVLGMAFTPEDNARGVRLALAEALNSGITTVHNWSHNLLSPDYADAELEAHRQMGGRARFSYGYSRKTGPNEQLPLKDIAAVHQRWIGKPGNELITFGIAARGPLSNPITICREEWEFGRKLGIGITTHVGIAPGKPAGIKPLADAGLLGPDVILVHATNATDEDFKLLGDSKTWVSLSPYTELRTGFGVTPVSKFLAATVPVALSVDTTVLCGNADMFGIMRGIQNCADGLDQSEFALAPRRVLEMGTINGAQSLGIDKLVGSLVPGKRADLILVRTSDLNMAPLTEPVRMIVQSAQEHNVDLVMVDGRILKRHGRLTAIDAGRIVADATETITRVKAQTGQK